MEYRETSQGAFIATGIGFDYHYHTHNRVLDIIRREKSKTLAHLSFDESLAKDPLSYVAFLEKATQLKALMFSNNQTVDLASIISSTQMPAMLKSASMTSRYAFDLKKMRLKRFCDVFSVEHGLKSIKIKKFITQNNTFFIARIQTHHDNGVVVRGCTLAGLTAALSDKTIRDLITMEFGHRYEGSAHNLLRVSTRLAALSCLLDDAYLPSDKIKIIDKAPDQSALFPE